MGMILRIASSRIVGQGDIVGRSGYFSLNLSANSVMRGRLDARRTLKSLVADLRISLLFFAKVPHVSICPKAKDMEILIFLWSSIQRIQILFIYIQYSIFRLIFVHISN